ncbi:RhuM family protein [Sinomicrobium sp. M5D2P9]
MQKEVVVAFFATTTQYGAGKRKTQTRQVEYYNLDAILSVGYLVNSKRSTQFFGNPVYLSTRNEQLVVNFSGGGKKTAIILIEDLGYIVPEDLPYRGYSGGGGVLGSISKA